MSTISEFEYNKEVKESTRSIIEQVAGDNELDTLDTFDKDAVEEIVNDYALNEYVDSHQWVIYDHHNQDILSHSDNEEYAIDHLGSDYVAATLKESGYKGLLQCLAYWAFYADIQGAFDIAFEEFENSLGEGEE